MLTMIINSNNKDNILKGSIKRGFNQTPEELREKLLNERLGIKKQNEPALKQENKINMSGHTLNNAFNNLKKMK